MKSFLPLLVASSFLAAPAFALAPQSEPERPVLDVVFVLDTTSSMGGLIEGAKQKIWSIASRMASGKPTPKVRVGLVAYRDHGDAYVTQVLQLTEDLDRVYSTLMGLQAEGGGDGPEAVQDGLQDAVEKMQWSDGKKVAKMIFVVGDAPAHDQDSARLYEVAKKAIRKNIVVNSIRCGQDATAGAQFAEMSRVSDGRFDTIDQAGGVIAVVTPFDAELAKLNSDLMDTTIYAGRREAMEEGESRKNEAKAMAPSAAADRATYASKTGEGASTRGDRFGAVDLAAAPEKAANMNDAELPAVMRKMSKEERVAYAKKQQAERKKIETRIAELAKQRDGYLVKQTSEKKDSFDARVFESVKKRAAVAGVAY